MINETYCGNRDPSCDECDRSESRGEYDGSESLEESDVPLSIRLENILKDFQLIENGAFNPIIYPFVDQNHISIQSAAIRLKSSPAEIFKTFCDENYTNVICADKYFFRD